MEEGDLVIVIDMQNVYLPKNPWECPSIKNSITNIKLIESKLSEGKQNLILTKFISPKEPKGCWIDYNKCNKEINKNEYLNEIVEDLQILTKKYKIFEKSTYSCFKSEEIKNYIKNYKRVVITGVVSECCVLSSVFEAIDLGIKVVYITDACSGTSEEKEKSVENIVKDLDYCHTVVISTKEYLNNK